MKRKLEDAVLHLCESFDLIPQHSTSNSSNFSRVVSITKHETTEMLKTSISITSGAVSITQNVIVRKSSTSPFPLETQSLILSYLEPCVLWMFLKQQRTPELWVTPRVYHTFFKKSYTIHSAWETEYYVKHSSRQEIQRLKDGETRTRLLTLHLAHLGKIDKIKEIVLQSAWSAELLLAVLEHYFVQREYKAFASVILSCPGPTIRSVARRAPPWMLSSTFLEDLNYLYALSNPLDGWHRQRLLEQLTSLWATKSLSEISQQTRKLVTQTLKQDDEMDEHHLWNQEAATAGTEAEIMDHFEW
jgi:hypothetical protein